VAQRLLLISRDDILAVARSTQGDKLFRVLARLTRLGFLFLATAPQADEWSSDSGGPDDALLGPDSIRRRLADAGGVIDGIYYVPRSLFTQRRNREEALRDIMGRYSVAAENCYLFSSSQRFAEAAGTLGMRASPLSNGESLLPALRALLSASSG
jgi:hypothetical protein